MFVAKTLFIQVFLQPLTIMHLKCFPSHWEGKSNSVRAFLINGFNSIMMAKSGINAFHIKIMWRENQKEKKILKLKQNLTIVTLQGENFHFHGFLRISTSHRTRFYLTIFWMRLFFGDVLRIGNHQKLSAQFCDKSITNKKNFLETLSVFYTNERF